MTYYAICRFPVGWCAVVASQAAVKRIFLAAPEREDVLTAVSRQFPDARPDAGACVQAVAFLERYFYEGDDSTASVSFDPGTATRFQGRVWNELRTVPFGQVRSYGWLAGRLGCPGAARAVGTALGCNPLPPIIPCHRIVRSDGRPGGFSAMGGPPLKRQLLEHEGIMFDAQGRVKKACGLNVEH